MSPKIRVRPGQIIGFRRNGCPIYAIAGGAPTIEELASGLESLRTEIAELDAIEEPTDEQTARYEAAIGEWDERKADHDKLVARFEKQEQIRTAALNPANVERGFQAPQVKKKSDPFEDLEALRYADPRDQDIVARAVTALTDYRPRGVSDGDLQRAVHAVETISGVAAHAIVHNAPAYRSAFAEYMRTQGQNPLFDREQADALRASMALGGSTGGYVLPTLLDPTLIHTGTATKNPIRSIARVISGTQNVWHGVSVGNVTTAWTAEATAMSDGSPTFSNPSITAGKLTAYLTASYEIFEDSDLQSQLPGLIGEAFAYAEGTAFITGSGTNGPTGIVTAISATAASTVTATTRGAFTSASAVDVFALLGSLPSRYEDTSTWVANKSWFNTVRQMSTGSQGSYFWTNFNNDVVGQGGNQPLLGSPIVQASDMNTSFASGSVIAVLGDWSQFVIYDRVGTMVEFVPQVFNSSAAPLGQRGLIAHKRVGSNCTDINAFRFLKA